MSLKNKAQETLAILQAGQYISASEKVVNFASEQQSAEANTKLYNPEEFKILSDRLSVDNQQELTVEVTDETLSRDRCYLLYFVTQLQDFDGDDDTK